MCLFLTLEDVSDVARQDGGDFLTSLPSLPVSFLFYEVKCQQCFLSGRVWMTSVGRHLKLWQCRRWPGFEFKRYREIIFRIVFLMH